MPKKVPRDRLITLASYALVLMLLSLNVAQAELFYKGEVTLRLDPGLSYLEPQGDQESSVQDSVGLTFQAHLEAELELLDSLSLNLMLDPGVRFSTPAEDDVSSDIGLTEAYLLWRNSEFDVSAGVERLPLETARLTRPFSLESSSDLGLPQGLLGARASYYSNNWRFRSAIFYQEEQVGAVFSLRRDFLDFELEAHAVLDQNLSFGLGGSGLVGDIVVYGEAWLVDEPPEAVVETEEPSEEETPGENFSFRAALGLSGFIEDALWTAEVAYAPLRGADTAPVPQALGQVNIPLGDVGSIDATLGLALVDSLLESDNQLVQTSAAISYSHSLEEANINLGLSWQGSELASVYGLSLGVTYFID